MLALALSLLAQFPPVPKPPELPKPSIPGLPGSSSSSPGGTEIVEEPRFIYKLVDHPELPVQFDKLKEEQLVRIIKRAKAIIPSQAEYEARKKEPARYKGSVHALKGLVLEEAYFATPEFEELLAWAREKAGEEGIAPSDVVLIQDLQDARRVRLPQNNEPIDAWAAVTDGVLAAVIPELSRDMVDNRYKGWRGKLVDAEGMPLPGKYLRIYAVIESKTPGQARKLAKGSGGDSGQLEWDFERFFELPLRFGEQEEFPPSHVFVRRKETRWVSVLPYQWRQAFSPEELQTLDTLFKERLKDFNHASVETQVLNGKAEVVADNVFYCLHVRGFFKDY